MQEPHGIKDASQQMQAAAAAEAAMSAGPTMKEALILKWHRWLHGTFKYGWGR